MDVRWEYSYVYNYCNVSILNECGCLKYNDRKLREKVDKIVKIKFVLVVELYSSFLVKYGK